MLLEVKKPTTAKRQHFERKWRYLQRLLSRQKTTGFQAAGDNLGPMQQTEEHEILQPRKALVQTQIDVEKVRRYQTFEFIFQAWRGLPFIIKGKKFYLMQIASVDMFPVFWFSSVQVILF